MALNPSQRPRFSFVSVVWVEKTPDPEPETMVRSVHDEVDSLKSFAKMPEPILTIIGTIPVFGGSLRCYHKLCRKRQLSVSGSGVSNLASNNLVDVIGQTLR